jgi:hypothetical protein
MHAGFSDINNTESITKSIKSQPHRVDNAKSAIFNAPPQKYTLFHFTG